MDVADEDQENQTRVDELIDRGLEHYGNGALKEALADWKHAQALSPSCERVREYIKLVESHYELSTSEFSTSENDGDEDEEDELTMERPANRVANPEDAWDMGDVSLESPLSSAGPSKEPPANTLERNSEHGSVASGEILSGTLLNAERARARERAWSELDSDVAQAGRDDDRTTSFFVPTDDGQLELEPPSRRSVANVRSSEDRTESLRREFPEPNFELEISDDSESKEGGTLELAPMNLGDLGLRETSKAIENAKPQTTSGLSFDDELTNFHVSLTPDQTTSSADERKDHSDVEVSQLDLSQPPAVLSESDGTLELRQSNRSVQVDPDPSAKDEGGMLSFEDATKELDLNSMEMGPSFGSANTSDKSTPKPQSEHVVTTRAIPAAIADVQSGGIELGLSEEEMSELQVGDTPTVGTSKGILGEICASAPSESASERTTYIVTKLIKHAIEMTEREQFRSAASSSMHALEYADDNAIAQKLVVESERQLIRALIFGLGDLSEIPRLLVPMTEIPFEEIDHRAAFLLTRLDGTLTLEEILDVSGMPRLEALRHLTRLFVRGYVLIE